MSETTTSGPCVTRIEVGDAPNAAFPGRLPKDDFRVTLNAGAHAAIRTHAGSSLDKEVCGVLLGRLKKDAGGPYLVVEDVIEGQDAQSAAARVTFTPDSWNYIFKEQESRDPDLKMVGWYHTHPRFGIFLSKYDQFISENFFAVQPWMVAYVVDPVRDEEGFFVWSKGKTQRLERYWIGDQPRRSDGAEFDGRELASDHAPEPEAARPAAAPLAVSARPAQQGSPPAEQGDGLLMYIAIGVLALLLIGALMFNQLMPSRSERDIREVRLLQEKTLLQQQKTLLHQADLMAEIQELRKLQGLPPSKRITLIQLERRLRRDLREAAAIVSRTRAKAAEKTP